MNKSITLISLSSGESAGASVDRGGGEAQGAVTTMAAKLANSIPIEGFSEKFVEIIDKVKVIAENLKVGVGGYEAEEITINLAVTAEGNIGIATAGVEASIEVCLRRNKPCPTRRSSRPGSAALRRSA